MASDRRSFFKQLVRAAAEVAQEVTGAVNSFDEPAPLETWEPPRPVTAKPAGRSASEDDLRALCREHGLEKRVDDVLRLARPSFRLTRAADDEAAVGASRLGGAPDAPTGFDWPRRGDAELAFVGQIRLADAAALDPAFPLPHEGLLLVFYDLAAEPNGLEPAHRDAWRVLLVPDDPAALERHESGPAPLAEYPLRLSRELTLPRQWHSAIEALELDADEFAAWDELRTALAALQEVELEDASPDWQALHRLLGWPEEVGGEMELDCQLVTNGVDLAGDSGYGDERVEELRPGAPDWRLLLQVSVDDELRSTFGDGFGRLYLWLREDDLRAGNLAAAWALLQ